MTIFIFDVSNHITGTAEAKVANFCMQVEYIKSYPCDDRLPHGRGQGHVIRFFLILPNYIFGIDEAEARHFKFRVLFDTQDVHAWYITPERDVFRVT